MSRLGAFFAGWRFRTSTPSLPVGQAVNVFVAAYDGDDVGLAYVGDTRLYVEGIDPDHVEKRVRVQVTEFDEAEAVGRGEYVETVGESSYAG